MWVLTPCMPPSALGVCHVRWSMGRRFWKRRQQCTCTHTEEVEVVVEKVELVEVMELVDGVADEFSAGGTR